MLHCSNMIWDIFVILLTDSQSLSIKIGDDSEL